MHDTSLTVYEINILRNMETGIVRFTGKVAHLVIFWLKD